MTIKYERLYGVPCTARFTLWTADGVSRVSASAVLGDSALSIDNGASATTTNLFSARASGMGTSIILTSAEMRGHSIFVRIEDRSGDATLSWMDEALIIETYGNELSQHNRRNSGIILETTIEGITDNSNFTIVDKPNDNNTLLNSVVLIYDDSGGAEPVDRSFRSVITYTGGTGAVELQSDTDFTIAVSDRVVFMPTADISDADTIASAVWDVTRSLHTTGGSFGEGVLVESLTTTASAQVSAIVATALSLANILDTNDLPTNFGSFAITGAGAVTVGTNNDKEDYYLALSAYTSAADHLLTRNFVSAVVQHTAADRSAINALRFLRNKWSIAGTVLTVTEEDDSTTAWISNLTTAASANTVTESDPT